MVIDGSSIKKLKTIDIQSLRDSLLSLPRWLLGIWIAVNIIIPAYGILLYYWQYAYYHPIFWIFIPDSNTSAILFGMFLFVTLGLKKNIQVLNIVTFIGLIRAFFGFIVVFTVQPSFFDIVALAAHTFELCEGLTLLLFIKTDLKNYILAASITLIDWFFDFFNPFDLPTLVLYPFDANINPNNTAPYITIFAVVFITVIVGCLIYIRLKHWIPIANNVKWIVNLEIQNQN
ncbi:MAG: DUF1405 domain-containing protein [Candidatus Hodarchaeales archaeon]|jgi:uncharacterized membrane protein YpjA